MPELNLQQAFDLARLHQQSGRLAEAEMLYRQILSAQPNHVDAIQLLGVLEHQRGNNSIAIDLIQRAINVSPKCASCYSNLGMVLASMGRLPEAIDSFRRALAIHPDSPEMLNNLGNALQAVGQLDEAIAAQQRAVQLRPGYALAHNNLGTALCAADKAEDGIASFKRAIALEPTDPQAHFNLAKAYHQLARIDEALEAINLALSLDPNFREAWTNLGVILQGRHQLDAAMEAYRRALSLRPDDARAMNNLGVALQEKRNYDEAIATYRRALAIRPDHPETLGNLANTLSQIGEHEEALQLYQRVLALNPQPRTASGYLLFLHLHADVDATRLREEHAKWNQKFARPLARHARPHENNRDPDRRLRIGYVSPDFTEHPVGRFILPLLANHDHANFEIFCYSDARVTDSMTQQLRQHADTWRETWPLSDAKLADRAREDRIDILVDLLMHAKGSRMLAFAGKPAPVQVTYLSYASMTGLETMDYRLSDPYLDPPGEDESLYTERTIRLSSTYWCFQPSPQMPEVGPLPATTNGYVTFGCLNNFWKVTPQTRSAWMRLLLQVPNSRLILHCHEGSHRQRLLGQFAQGGIAANRIEFVGFQPLRQYFEQYNGIDIALDPFPYGGGTTTCEALWMGVPVVTLLGKTAVGRAGYSILSNIALAELVGRDMEEYVRLAAGLATDLPRISELRRTMRSTMRSSPLMDAPRFAHDVEEAYRAMWRSWCGADVESFARTD